MGTARSNTFTVDLPTTPKSSCQMRISLRWPLIRSLTYLIRFCAETCLNRNSARTPKIPLTRISYQPIPSRSNGTGMNSNARMVT